MGVPAKIEEFRPGSPEAVESAVREGWKFRVDLGGRCIIKKQKRLQEHGIHDRENPGRGSNLCSSFERQTGRLARAFPLDTSTGERYVCSLWDVPGN
jgi:hypothetical protein